MLFKKKFFLLSALVMLVCTVQAQLTLGKVYRLVLSQKSLFVKDASFSVGQPVVLWAETNVPAQRWTLESASNGCYAFRNVYTGLYLAYTGNAGVGSTLTQQIGRVKANTGAWYVKPVEGKTGVYNIYESAGQKYCIGIDRSASDGDEATLVDPETISQRNYAMFRIVEDSAVAIEFNAGVRDQMMTGYIYQYYKPANVGHVLGEGGWWGDAEMFEVILDAFETTGNKVYQTYFDELFRNFVNRNGSDWSYNAFNDDISWMVLACVRGYKFFGNKEYLDVGKTNFDMMYQRAAMQPHGTLIWKQDQENPLSTNSCINGPATVAACYLGEMTGDSSYYDKALSIYAGQRKLLFNAETGQVYDCRAWTADGGIDDSNVNWWASTYNQGTMLGAASMLYTYTGDEQYKHDAEMVYRYTYNEMTDSKKIIRVCQNIDGDLCGFKGILMRYVRRYAEDLNHPEALDWIAKNAWHAFQNRMVRGQSSVTWSAWLTKTATNLIRIEGDNTMNVTNHPFGASTALSAAFNAHINGLYHKAASTRIDADLFDEIKWLQLASDGNSTDDGEPETTVCDRAGGYIAFKHVDFGTGSNIINVCAKAEADNALIQVYIDKVVPESLVVQSGDVPLTWTDLALESPQEITGEHTLYFVTAGSGAVAFRSFFVENNHSSGISSVIQKNGHASRYVYNLQGQIVDSSYNGIVIKNGKKIIQR